jgi:hypothetical protein
MSTAMQECRTGRCRFASPHYTSPPG